MGSEVVKQQALQVATGTAQLTIPLNGLRTFDIDLPTIDEQSEIVKRIERLFAFADRLEERLAISTNQLIRLTPALLAKAFRGELVPQDPSDEPAQKMLERLRTAKSGEPIKATSRGRKRNATT
jgi:type I restriction enzyme S subunit